jgi:hypothetical protein
MIANGLATDMPQTQIYGEYTIKIVGPNETEDTSSKDSKPSSATTPSLYSKAVTYHAGERELEFVF